MKNFKSTIVFLVNLGRFFHSIFSQKHTRFFVSSIIERKDPNIKSVLDHVRKLIRFFVDSYPSIVTKGTAKHKFSNHDLNNFQGELLTDFYPLKSIDASLVSERIITYNLWSFELSMRVTKVFLNKRLVPININSKVYELMGSGVHKVASARQKNTTIGQGFLKVSSGIMNLCFQMELLNLVDITRSFKLNALADYWDQVIRIHDPKKLNFQKRLYNQCLTQ